MKLRSNVRDWTAVDWNDVLGRATFQVDRDSVRHVVAGKVVLVTGAAGSIGSALCRYILECQPAKLICLDRGETDLFYLQTTLGSKRGDAAIVYCVQDFGDSDAMRYIFTAHQIQIVFHAAGYKHVPIMEQNPRVALENNVFGLMRFLDVCRAALCEAFVMISSDKAVNPVSVMGCTKRLGELILASRDYGSMRAISVRFGNVIGSQGSVVPIFLKQIADNQPLTVTDNKATRLFMTVGEAVSLLLHAGKIGKSGEILVLEIGDPIRIEDLARAVFRRFSGRRKRKDPAIKFTSLRPGEKLHEELFYQHERALPTSCQMIKRVSGIAPSWPQLKSQLDALRNSLYALDDEQLRVQIQSLIPEYRFEPVTSEIGARTPTNRKANHKVSRPRNGLLSPLIGQIAASGGPVLNTESPS